MKILKLVICLTVILFLDSLELAEPIVYCINGHKQRFILVLT